MPRIAAPTLAEHRDRRRAALLAAGHALVVEGGTRAVTMAAVAARTGLSRPAVYEYFTSTEDLLAAVLLEEMRSWAGEVTDALATRPTPEEKVREYVRVSLTLIADGRHEILEVMSEANLPPHVQQQLGALHATLAAPLTTALEALGVDDLDRGVRYIQGVVEAAARRITPGQPVDDEIDEAAAFVLAGLSAIRSRA